MHHECLHTDFHNKHYFINLLVNDTWNIHKQGQMIMFKLRTGHNGPNLDWKRKKKKKL